MMKASAWGNKFRFQILRMPHFQLTYVKITNEPIILQIRGVYLDHI